MQLTREPTVSSTP